MQSCPAYRVIAVTAMLSMSCAHHSSSQPASTLESDKLRGLREVRIGMSLNEVRALAGEPDMEKWGAGKAGRSQAVRSWKYFDEGTLAHCRYGRTPQVLVAFDSHDVVAGIVSNVESIPTTYESEYREKANTGTTPDNRKSR